MKTSVAKVVKRASVAKVETSVEAEKGGNSERWKRMEAAKRVEKDGNKKNRMEGDGKVKEGKRKNRWK